MLLSTVLVDTTAPIPGVVVDGDDINDDVDFTSETSRVAASWSGFSDPESGLGSYTVSVYVNNSLQRSVAADVLDEHFTEHSFALDHGDTVHVEVAAANKAGAAVIVASDGLKVDHTSPELVTIGTARTGDFQQDDTSLRFVWKFQDPDSGLAEYRCSVLQRLHGVETQFWPAGGGGGTDQHVVPVNATSEKVTQDLHLPGLSLVNGASYSVKVTAVNKARMSATAGSGGVTVDTTPPVVGKVRGQVEMCVLCVWGGVGVGGCLWVCVWGGMLCV